MQGCFYCTVTVSLVVSHTVRAQPVISADTLCVLIGERSVLFGCVARGGKDPTGWGIAVTYISQSVGIVEGAIRATSAQHRWRQLQRLIQHSALVLLSKLGSAAATSIPPKGIRCQRYSIKGIFESKVFSVKGITSILG